MDRYTISFDVRADGSVITQAVVPQTKSFKREEFGAAGALLRSTESPEGFVRFWDDGAGLLGFGTDGKLYRERGGQRSVLRSGVQLPKNWRLARGAGEIAVIDAVQGAVSYLDPKRESAEVMNPLTTPELERARAAAVEHRDRWAALPDAEKTGKLPSTMTVVYAAAIDAEGAAFLAVGAFPAKAGAPVIKVSRKGQVLGRYTFPVTDGVSDRLTFMPFSLAVLGNRLFVSDATGLTKIFAL